MPCSSRVIPANIAVDLNQKDKWLHFDNSTFLAGVEHIEALWSRIEAGVALHDQLSEG